MSANKRSLFSRSLCGAYLALLVGLAGGDARGEKFRHSWLNPTPSAELRELSTDRPDATEGPFTVDAGHTQLEMDVVNHRTNRLEGVRTKGWSAAAFNLRFGLLDDFELGIFVSPYVHASETQRVGRREVSSGFGDVTLRAKVNFWGNNGGTSALGLIADLKLPTAARGLGSDSLEGAVLLPVSLELGHGWELGAMTGMGLRRRASSSGRRGVGINSATTGHGITEALAGYVELTAETGDGAPVAAFDAGLTLQLNRNTQVDVGVQFGLSRNADDVVVFVGWTQRY